MILLQAADVLVPAVKFVLHDTLLWHHNRHAIFAKVS